MILLWLGTFPAMAQHYGGSVAVGGVYIPQWNKAIEVHNFSRPYLSEPLETYNSGFHVQGYWINRPYRSLAVGPMVNYTRNCLSASVHNLEVDVHLQRLEIETLIRLRKVAFKKDLNSFFIDLSPGIQLCHLARRHNGNGVFVLSDEATLKRVQSFGLGLGLGFKMGYSVYLNPELLLSPFFMVKYTPYLYAPNSINVFNQVSIDGLRDYSSVYDFRMGFEVSFCKAAPSRK